MLAGVAGSVVFSALPFQACVKGGDIVQPPRPLLPPGWAGPGAAGLQAAAARGDVSARAGGYAARRHALRVSHCDGSPPACLRADGVVWTPPDEDTLRRFATAAYRGSAAVLAVERLERVPLLLGIVAETGGRGDLWRVRFDDALATRIYLDGASGDFVTSDNDACVWYDFFFRLRVMDYTRSEDFNGTLQRTASITALGPVLAGAVLAVPALRRRWDER